MTDGSPSSRSDREERTVFRVPDSRRDGINDVGEGFVNRRDLGSASRSCLAIIIVLVVILLLLCVFLTVQTFR
ncbi:MAG: hypothetical protein M3440_10445 [Chloroflexota bacterium]|nr:hypothetical protein [Chloroflexota bacterium]